jgi:hypothetical protein
MSPAEQAMNDEVVERKVSAPYRAFGKAGERAQVPESQVGLSPPPAYREPMLPADSAAALAGGYDLAFNSLGTESVTSGKEARRVPLMAETWPVSVERRIYPAVSHDAYVTAEVRYPGKRALPGGTAQLSVGADPAGTARLALIVPGETFTLPLGLDRAIKPVRNVKLAEAVKGVFSKDDVGDYSVTIEVANPYRAPLTLRVYDQYPLTDDKNVDVKLGAVDPPVAAEDKRKGTLEWRITVPASGKSVLRFGYTIRRPRGYRMHQ